MKLARGNKLAIYMCGRRFEFRLNEKKIPPVARAELNKPGTTGLQVRLTGHLATLPWPCYIS